MKDLVVAIYRERKRFPEKNVVIQKFSSFYLPASVKLLHRYAELEQQIERTKEQEEFLLRLKSAFMDVRNGLKTLWNSMTEPEDLELSAEVTVMAVSYTHLGRPGYRRYSGCSFRLVACVALDFAGRHLFRFCNGCLLYTSFPGG